MAIEDWPVNFTTIGWPRRAVAVVIIAKPTMFKSSYSHVLALLGKEEIEEMYELILVHGVKVIVSRDTRIQGQMVKGREFLLYDSYIIRIL